MTYELFWCEPVVVKLDATYSPFTPKLSQIHAGYGNTDTLCTSGYCALNAPSYLDSTARGLSGWPALRGYKQWLFYHSASQMKAFPWEKRLDFCSTKGNLIINGYVTIFNRRLCFTHFISFVLSSVSQRVDSIAFYLNEATSTDFIFIELIGL